MNPFFSSTEILVFTLLAIPFAGAVATVIVMLYSEAFMQAHAVLARKIFNSKSTKVGRMIVLGILAVIAHFNHWLMVETLLLAIIAYFVCMLVFFHNKGFVNTSHRKP